MTDVDAITEGIPSSSDIGDFIQQEENDLEVGTMKQLPTPHENESSLNRESAAASGSEDQQTDLDTINPWSDRVPEPGPFRDSELGPDGDLDTEVAVPMRTTRTDSLIGVETDINVTNDRAGVIGEQSTASMGSTGCSETPIETVNHQQPIFPAASKIAPEEENLAKVGNLKAPDSEDEKDCRTSPEQGENSPSNNGSDCSPDSLAPSYSTDAAVPPEDPNPSPRSQVEHKLTKADHLQSVVTDNGEPLEDRTHCSQVHSTEDVRYSKSLHSAQVDLGVDNSSECVPPSFATVAIVVAPWKHPTSRIGTQVEKSLTNADHLQPVGTNTAKPVQYQGQTEDVGNKNSSHGTQGDLGVGDSSENTPPLYPPVAGVVARTKHSTLSRREKKPRNADHLHSAGTDTAKPLEYQGQPEDVGNNNSLHGVRGVFGAENSFECVSTSNPIDAAVPAEHHSSKSRAQLERKLSNPDHLQPAGTNNAKPFEIQGQGLQAFSKVGISHCNSLDDAQVDRGVDDSSDCAPPIFSVPHEHANADCYQLAGSNKDKHPEDQGQGLQQGHRREGVGHITSLQSMQGDHARNPKSMSTCPQTFQQPSVAGIRSGVYQTNQAGTLRTSLLEHVQPQRPQIWTKVSKLGPCDGERQIVPITQHQIEDPKPVNNEADASVWHRKCISMWNDNNRLDREVDSYRNQLCKMKQQIQDLTLELKQEQEKSTLLSKHISKYEQQHAQEMHRSGSYLDDSKAATPALLVSALNGVKDASNNFAKAFKAQVDSSPSTIQVNVKQYLSQNVGRVSRTGHIKFQYQAFICQRLFEGFNDRNFGVFESTPGLPVTTVEHCFRQYQMHDFKKSDTVERLFQHHPEIDNFLHEYCFRKFSLIFDSEVEGQLFDGKREHNDSIAKYEHPHNSRFYRSYCKLAVSIWLVHRLAFSFKQPAKLFCPFPGMPFNNSNMQSVVPLDSASDDEDVQAEVGFCVIPGMKVGESIVPSEVYIL